MSIAGIASTVFSQLSSLQGGQQGKVRSEFQQLSQDLQSGNLSQAQSDYTTLQQSLPAGFAASGSPTAQALSQLGKDLQAGNLSAAQQDFAGVQQDVQQAATHHHHHHGGGASSTQQNSIAQLFSTLGQDLQGNNLAGAQSAYTSLSQSLPFLSANGTTVPAVNGTTVPAVNVSA
jgi:outer membrane protein assembly factor BamD (BamD/ComL family)